MKKNIYFNIMNLGSSYFQNYLQNLIYIFSYFNILFICPPIIAQEVSLNGYLYIEAKEWNKKDPEQPKWKTYPTMTVDSLKNISIKTDNLNKYGSFKEEPQYKATGFFYAKKINKRWIIVDPEGYIHINAAVVGLRTGTGEINKKYFSTKYNNEQDWIVKTINELISYGFNGAGTWSNENAIRQYNDQTLDKKFSYCPIFNLMSGYGKELKITKQLSGNIGYPNQCIRTFDPGFKQYCEKRIPILLAKYKDDPNIIGYFSDNELPISTKNLEGYLNLPKDDYGRKAAEKWLHDKHITRDSITDKHRTEFAGYVADTYYSIVNNILKKYDPNHMYLGSRLHGSAKFVKEIIQAAGRHCDVISFNYYGFWEVRKKDIENWEIWTDKPFIITEFYTKAEDSNLSNVTGAGWKVHTQKDRGFHYENFILGLLRSNNCVGWSWFKYQDNDPTAKGVDPSNLNSNKGCYDNRYEPYHNLVSSMKKVNTIKYNLIKQFISSNLKHTWPDNNLGGGERLFYDEQTFHEIRNRIDKFEWANELFKKLKDRVFNGFHDTPYKNLFNDAYWTKEAAMYYRISGDESCIKKIVQNIIRYYKLDQPSVRLFPTNVNRDVTYFWQRVMENDCRYLLAYDLVKNHKLLRPYETIMKKRMDEIIAEGKLYESRIKRLGNTQFWGVTALGLYGFMRNDNEAINIAINGKNGFKSLLSKFRDNGCFWPEPKHYVYGYVDCCLLMLAEATRHNHWIDDLYNYEDPTTRASIHKMLLSLLSVCTPDGYLIANGEHSEFARALNNKLFIERTSFFNSKIMRENIKLPIYYKAYKDPQIAWAMNKRPNYDFFCVQIFGNPALVYGAETDNIKEPDAKSVVFQEMGDALIRSNETKEYWNGKGLTVYLRNGASQQFHGNDDHCSININAFGKNLYNHWFLYWDYLCPRKGRGNHTPLSFTIFNQNTVAVDCKGPVCSNIHLSQNKKERKGLKFSEIERLGNMKRISVSGEIYEGVNQKRTLCVTNEYVLDMFQLESSQEHIYDYILHSWGDIKIDGVTKKTINCNLNKEYGFGEIDSNSQKRVNNIWFLSCSKSVMNSNVSVMNFYDQTDSVGIKACILPDKSTVSEIISAYTPYYVDTDKGWDGSFYEGEPERKPMGIVRRKCKSTTFIAIHQPYKKAPNDMKISLNENEITITTTYFTDTYNIKTGSYKRQ